MEAAPVNVGQLATTAKDLARGLLLMGENRLELLTVEAQEERERLLHALLLAFGIAGCGLLAGLTLTAALVVALWAWSPVVVLLILTGLYGGAALLLCRQLTERLRDWQTLSATLEQLRKDRVGLEEAFE
jgi:uncharacterized membrane protein YqjE